MGSVAGIVTVLTFVGLPFYINTVKNGLEDIPDRLEKASRSLGASMSGAFFRVTLPLAWRSMLVGMIMCLARAISEFGAVVIVAYHPMTAPVMIYERFTAYGLKYSQPVAVWLILVCLALFFILRLISLPAKART
jgi:molybdate/tungstate transport system permease protein